MFKTPDEGILWGSYGILLKAYVLVYTRAVLTMANFEVYLMHFVVYDIVAIWRT